MTERGPEIDAGKVNTKIGVEKGSDTDGTVDTFYYNPNVKPEPMSGDALKTMPEAKRQEYLNLLDQLKGVCGLNDKESSFSDGQKAGAWASVAAVLVTGAGVALSPDNANAETKTPTKIVAKGEMTSQSALVDMGVEVSDPVPQTIAPPTETETPGVGVTDGNSTPAPDMSEPAVETPAPSILDLVAMSDENFEKYIKETRELAMNLDIPLTDEVIERMKNGLEAWRIKTFGKYEDELREDGATNEQWIKRGAQWLYAWDNSTWLNNKNPDEKFQNYVSREEIVKYVVEGKSKNVFCDPDGRPLFLMVNMTDKMKKGVKAGLELLVDGGVEDVYDYFYESGFCVLFAALLEPDQKAGRALLNEYGVTGFNLTEDNTKKAKVSDLAYTFERKVLEEAFGVDFYQLNVGTLAVYKTSIWGESIDDCEVFKKINVGEILLGIKDDNANLLGTGLINSAKEDYYDSAKSNLYNRETEIMIGVFNLAGKNFLVTTEK